MGLAGRPCAKSKTYQRPGGRRTSKSAGAAGMRITAAARPPARTDRSCTAPKPGTARRPARSGRQRCGRARPAPQRPAPAGQLPSPTRRRVPTMLRTWWCRKLRASAAISIRSPCRTTSSRSSVRSGLLAWQAAARKLVKSCRPSRHLRRRRHRRRIERVATCHTRPASSAGRGAAVQDHDSDTTGRSRRTARSSPARRGGGAEHHDAVRLHVEVQRVPQPLGRDRAIAARVCATWPSACTPGIGAARRDARNRPAAG